MNQFVLNIILFIHLCVVLFVLIVPFMNSNYLLLIHSIIVPFIMIHWILNNNTCALSLMEKQIRKKMNNNISVDDNDCFTCRIINPIYDFKSNFDQFSNFIYFITTILWLISLHKLYTKYKNGKIRSFYDLTL